MDIGQYQTLKIHRRTDHGFYLINESEEEVLLPNKYIDDDMELEDDIEVFVYIDSSDLPVATTEIPYLVVGEFAYLKVSDVTNFGAYSMLSLT